MPKYTEFSWSLTSHFYTLFIKNFCPLHVNFMLTIAENFDIFKHISA
jgi:hypothetical protein